jgi:Spy/CpxP family protein refolding chaperone
MTIRWNQVAIAAAAGFLLGAFFSDVYRLHRRPGPPHGMGSPVEMFGSELDLSATQKDQVSKLFEKYRPEMDKVMEENRPKMDAVRKKLDAEIRALLTPEQSARMDKLEQNFSKRMGGGPGGPHGEPPHGHGGW